MSEEVSIELFRAGNLLPPRGNEEGGYDFYEEAYAAWETQTASEEAAA